MTKNLIFASVCFLLAATIASSQSKPFGGLYRPSGDAFAHWDCETVGQDGGAILINGDELWETESFCALENPVRVTGLDATLFDAECRGPSGSWSERIMLMVADEGVFFVTNRFVTEWKNCAFE